MAMQSSPSLSTLDRYLITKLFPRLLGWGVSPLAVGRSYRPSGSMRSRVARWANKTAYSIVATKLLRNHPFRNWGYSPPNGPTIELEEQDEPYRLNIEHYHRLFQSVEASDKDILEIGSGMGGGASFMAKYLRPRRVVGVDLAPSQVNRSKSLHASVPALSFSEADAAKLPFEESSFDIVVNLESAHCYPSMPAFLDEVRRVLRPGGHLLFADLHATGTLPQLEQAFASSGLRALTTRDITAGVLRAVEVASERPLPCVAELSAEHPEITECVRTWLAHKGSPAYESLRSGYLRYMEIILQKPVR